jgi:hypothetical protein
MGALSADGQNDCLVNPAAHASSGPVTGSIAPLPDLYERAEKPESVCGTHAGDDPGRKPHRAGIAAVTAALLSARFPLITPSGALLRCLSLVAAAQDPTTASSEQGANEEAKTARSPEAVEKFQQSAFRITYAVDGGYYENTGLLTLLQMWTALEPLVRAHNQEPDTKSPIVPWVLIIDNHYRSVAEGATPRRPLETHVPLQALTSNRALSSPALEQMAVVAMQSHREPPFHNLPVGHVTVVAPRRRPAIEAPLGWVLSEMSRRDLDSELDGRLHPSARSDQSTLDLLVHLLADSGR